MSEDSVETPEARRVRRLRELGRRNQMPLVNAAVREIWEQENGRRPDQILLRPSFLASQGDDLAAAAPMSRLITSRGVALRFYLLALFEAQCRPPSREPWKNTRPVAGRTGWQSLIAVDAAYSQQARGYQRPTIQDRDLVTSRVRQVKAALRKLEEPAGQALVEVPRKANGKDRDYGGFLLMKEPGRGRLAGADYYTPPEARGERVIGIPAGFFLNGWAQVLYSSEIATWLALRFMSSSFPGEHAKAGVYLYGQDRKRFFGLERDTYEDGCRNLVEFGLIRRPQLASGGTGSGPVDFGRLFAMLPQVDENGQIRYKANRYQLADGGFAEDAYMVTMTSLRNRGAAG